MDTVSIGQKAFINRVVFAIAGSFILLSVGLSYYIDPRWLYFTLFVGANMFQSAFTQFCLLAIILQKLGVGKGR